VSSNFFDTLAIRPVKGRTFTERENRLDPSGLVVVISHLLWIDRFAAPPDIVGRTITIA